jgi:energy-coupling factor transporter ATP-binding protein EcfA2
MELGTPQNLVILLFGWIGSGKSSFVNALFTLFHNRTSVFSGAATSGGGTHTTSKISYYRLPESRIALWDTWGLTRSNYQKGELRSLLHGELTPNWEMDTPLSARDSVDRDTKNLQRPRAVLFFVTVAIIVDTAMEQERESVRRQLQVMTKEGALLWVLRHTGVHLICFGRAHTEFNPILAVTQSRSTDNQLEIKELASTVFGVPAMRIMFCTNYTTERTPTVQVGLSTLRLVHAAVHTAQDFGDIHVDDHRPE